MLTKYSFSLIYKLLKIKPNNCCDNEMPTVSTAKSNPCSQNNCSHNVGGEIHGRGGHNFMETSVSSQSTMYSEVLKLIVSIGYFQ